MTQVSVRYAILAATLCSASMAFEMPSPPAVALYLDFEKDPAPAVVDAMKAEVGRILAPSGLRLEWQILEEKRNSQNFADLAVIRFHGVCGMAAESGSKADNRSFPPLASTHVADGRVLPYTDIGCTAIARYIAPLVTSTRLGANGLSRDGLFGRAVGRVVAHELYHIFLGTRKHAAGGVARAYHTRGELVAKQFDFRDAESDMFRVVWARMESNAVSSASAAVSVVPSTPGTSSNPASTEADEIATGR